MIPFGLHDLARAPQRTSRYWAWRLGHRHARLARPIFVVGCPRSGTSVASELAATHPDVANWSEAGRLWDPVDYSNPEADHCWEADRANEAEARRLHGWCEWYRCSQGRARFLNKHPRNSVRIAYLDAIFPDACYVHVVRDGRAVVHSMLRQIRTRPRRQRVPFGGFCKPPRWREWRREDLAEQTALQWREIVRYVQACGASLGPRYLEVRYEDFCERPRTTLATLFRFAGLPAGAEQLAGIPEKLESRNDGFRAGLSDNDLARVEDVQRELLGELGYPA